MTAPLRDAGELVLPAVRETLGALEDDPRHAGIVKLAERYAASIDAAATAKERAWALRWIGPLLLDALESLGASPASRSKLKEGAPRRGGSNQVAALRAARRA